MEKIDPRLSVFFDWLKDDLDIQYVLLMHAHDKDQMYRWMLNVMDMPNNLDKLEAVDEKLSQTIRKITETYKSENIIRGYHNILYLLQKFRRYVLTFFPEEDMFLPHYSLKL